MLLLDTCAILWLASGSNMLSNNAKSMIKNSPIVFVSAISSWEIALKYHTGFLELPLEPYLWFNKVLELHRIDILPLDLDILISSTLLPGHHKDPADRFIIASALKHDLIIITNDEKFKKYNVKIIS
jgi:PIN domain nuclease of toxin-antitoxin system